MSKCDEQDTRLELIRQQLGLNGYDLIQPIGNGAFATCYTIRSRKYEQTFVAKILDISQKPGESLPRSFKAEITSLINIIHPNVINIFNYFVCPAGLILILEYCPGGTISDMIKNSGPIQPPTIYNYCKQLLSALQQCHSSHIAHHDIKPSNVLLDQYSRPKLADFGLARHCEGNRFTDNIMGSLPYLPPEEFNKAPYDEFKADIWSLGVTFFVMASGRLPWQPSSKSEFVRQISTGLIDYTMIKFFNPNFNEMIRKMLDPNPNTRATLNELMRLKLFTNPESDVNQMTNISLSLSHLPSLKSIVSSSQLANQASSTLQLGVSKSISTRGILKQGSGIFAIKRRSVGAITSMEPTIPSLLVQ